MTEKTKEGEGDGRKLIRLIGERRATVKDTLDTLRRCGHVKAGGGARGRAWKPVEAGRRRELPACTVQTIYQIATHFIFQITFKFVWKLKNLQK